MPLSNLHYFAVDTPNFVRNKESGAQNSEATKHITALMRPAGVDSKGQMIPAKIGNEIKNKPSHFEEAEAMRANDIKIESAGNSAHEPQIHECQYQKPSCLEWHH